MLRLRQSKLFITFLIAIMLVFSYQVSKPKAFAPIPFLVAIGVGMAAEQMVTMGVKAGSKSILKKQAQNYSDDIARAGKFDWHGTNPYRNKDGSISLSPSANDRARMAGLIGGSLAGSMFLDGDSPGACVVEDMEDASGVATGAVQFNYINKDYASVYKEIDNRTRKIEQAYKTVMNPDGTIEFRNYVTGHVANMYLSQNVPVILKNGSTSGTDAMYTAWTVSDDVKIGEVTFDIGFDYFESANALTDSEIVRCGDVYFPKTVEDIYEYPSGIPEGYEIPNKEQLQGQTFIIQNIMPPSEDEGEITWQQIIAHVGEENFTQKVEEGTAHYLENGDMVTNNYEIGEINNFYTDIGQEKSKEEVEQELNEYVPVPVPKPEDNTGGDDLPAITPVDRSMLQVISESYAYLADSIDTSLVAMRKVVDGATGLVDFLDESFRWLPGEWRAMFGAAFILGVFAHFFRR